MKNKREFTDLDLGQLANYYQNCYDFYQDRKKNIFCNQVASLYEMRGQMDQAIEIWKGTEDTENENVHSVAVQAMLKSPTIRPKDLLEAHLKWAQKYASSEPVRGTVKFEPYDGKRKINIGYVCAWWDSSTIRGQAIPFIEEHDRFKFTFTAYSLGDCADRKLTGNFKKFVNVAGMSHDDFIAQVRSDKIDILCEFTGFSPFHRFAPMGGRCAPIQVHYLNHTGTSGVPNVDYVIGDYIATPPETDEYCTEKVYRLPGTFFCFNYEWDTFPETLPPPCLKSDYITFGCFGSQSKINDVQIRLWAELLKAVPNSRLFLRNYGLSNPVNNDFMERRFKQWGISPDRLRLEGGGDRYDILDNYNLVDISLDTWPYCGGNTIAESIWCGVPVITLQGDMFNSSYGASLLHSSGCGDLVAHSFEEFIDIAKKLAKDKERLVGYRKDLRTMMKKHGFADPVQFARKAEKMFEEMMRNWAGLD